MTAFWFKKDKSAVYICTNSLAVDSSRKNVLPDFLQMRQLMKRLFQGPLRCSVIRLLIHLSETWRKKNTYVELGTPRQGSMNESG